MSKYPEHEKLKAIQEQSQAIGEFIDWLQEGEAGKDYGPIHLAYYPYITERPIYDRDFKVIGYDAIPRDEWKRSSQLQSFSFNVQKVLAQFFGIDLNKIEEEKRAMLDECRKLHTQETRPC